MNFSARNCEPHESCEFYENLNILREIPFFSGLPLEALKVFAYLCIRVTFKVDDYIFNQKDDDGQAFYIISGEASLIHEDETGEQLIRNYTEGSFFGGLTLLGNLRRLFSLKALSEITCLVLTRNKFSRTLEQFPDLTPKIIKSVVESIRNWEKQFLVDRDAACDACKEKIGVSII
jgi:CRP-like cAMP-binding protein